MKLNDDQVKIIKQYVPEKFFDVEKLLNYLERQETVGEEVYSLIKNYDENNITSKVNTSGVFDFDDYYFTPVDIQTFIRRLPFYFYISKEDFCVYSLREMLFDIKHEERETYLNKNENDLYSALEKIFYEYNFTMDMIVTYVANQEDKRRERIYLFFEWYDYLEKIENLNGFEKMPKNFYTEYNIVLELRGANPIIYEPEWEDYGVGLFERRLNAVIFKGRFPCDKYGKPIIKWIGINIKDAEKIQCVVDKYSRGHLTIGLKPNTYIAALNPCRDREKDNEMETVYIGPKLMAFKHEVLKQYREQCHYSQQQVADMIGSALRTYQKWESGETTPDGHNLLRIMNVFDINDLREITKIMY